ncbi:outer membrane beta-barrel family protein [Niabella aquatica]
MIYATAYLISENGDALASAYSNENGEILLSDSMGTRNQLFLIISALNYSEKKISINAEGGSLRNIGNIPLMPGDKVLEAVTVTASKKIIELKPGVIVYNAENDVSNTGGTAADVLRKAPVLNVDGQGNVSMRGNSNLKILIDGKYSGQIARSPADALNMMPADLIKSVEVITTPSAKYDAEGAAGIINIITKKNRENFSGTMELVGGNREQAFNPRISANRGKWSFSLHGHLHQLQFRNAQQTERVQVNNEMRGNRLTQDLFKNNRSPHGSGDITVVFSPNEKTEWSLGANLWFGRWPDNSTITTAEYSMSGILNNSYQQQIIRREGYFGTDMNIGFNRKLRKPGQEITLLTQFTPSRSRSPYQFYLFEPGKAAPFYQEENFNTIRNEEWTFQADYVHPLDRLGKYVLETGGKAILRNVKNDYEVITTNNGEAAVTDWGRTDVFQYSQDIWAGYGIIKAKWENNWYAEGGIRYEATDVYGDFIRQSAKIKNTFHNLIPGFNITKKLNESHMLGLSYTQRITRPYIWDLNPNANASDPRNIEVGNPELKPEQMHQAEMTYGFQAKPGFFLNTAVFWKQTDNAIVDFTEINDQGIAVTRNENMASTIMYGVNLSASLRPSSSWSINSNLNVNYLNYTNNAWHVFNKGWAADMTVNTTYKLPQRYALQAFGAYNTRTVTIQGYKTQKFYYVFAVKKEVVKPKITVTIATANPFSAYIPQTSYISAPGFISTVKNRDYMRAFRITVGWEFGGNGKIKEVKKVVNDDIKSSGKE